MNLSDVMKQGSFRYLLDLFRRKTNYLSNNPRKPSDSLRVTRRVRIPKLNCLNEEFEQFLVGRL